MEKIFLETSVQLVSEGSSDLSDRQAEALEKLTFDWVLNAEKYVDVRFSELYKAREKASFLSSTANAFCELLKLGTPSCKSRNELADQRWSICACM